MIAVLLLIVLITQACAPDQTRNQKPETRKSETGPAVILPDGAVIEVELAGNEETRAQGLMYRESVPPGKGMLFLFPETKAHSFWMKNTLVPLDIIWIDEGRRIVQIARDLAPCTADPCPSYPAEAASRFALEIAAGQAAIHGLEVGNQLSFRDVDEKMAR